MRELKIGDRVVDWLDRAGTVLSVRDVGGTIFVVRYDSTDAQMGWAWEEFSDPSAPEGTFRFEDTEYPTWP